MSNQRGMALVLVLWILVVLIVLAAGLGMTTRSETQISRNYGDIARCRLAARGGVSRGLIEIESPGFAVQDGGTKVLSQDEGLDFGDATFEVKIEDEAGKVNINTAPEAVLQAILGREVAAAAMDWRDADENPRPLGAESQYYSSLGTPYRCRNAPFHTLRELLLVKGVTPELLSSPATENGQALEDILTVYSRDTNVDASGKERINITTASSDSLKSRLGDALTDKDIDAIVKWKGGRTVQSASEIALVPNLGRNKVMRIYDRLTASDAKMRPGLINVNTAPAEVLAAVPGLDRITAEEIVNYRDSKGPLSDVGQLLNISAVSTKAFAQAADLLTARSRVFRIICTGRIARTGSSESVVCVVDAVDGSPARIEYWRE